MVIPPRRNKLGKRFGFVRMINMEDVRLLAVRLDNILVDGRMIHANLPRFDRNRGNNAMGGSGFRDRRKFESGKEKGRFIFQKDWGASGRVRGFRNGVSFVGVLNKGKKETSSPSKEVFNFVSKEEDRKRLVKTFVGTMHSPGATYNVQTNFEVEEVFSIKVTPLGENICLLEEVEEGFISELVGGGFMWWKQWFKVIEPWRFKDVDSDKVTWIRVYREPCHAWCYEFFVSLTNSMGTFICIDENTTNKTCMDIAMIMVRVSSAFVVPQNLPKLFKYSKLFLKLDFYKILGSFTLTS